MAKNRNQDRNRNDRNSKNKFQQTSSRRMQENQPLGTEERSNQQVNQPGKRGTQGGNR